MDDIITLDYGSGGIKTSQLIEEVFVPAFANTALEELSDAASIQGAKTLAFSTDSFVVDPIFFPGGDIGHLAVCGTANDLLVSGAAPKYMSLACIIEEGFSMESLCRIAQSAAKTAKELGIRIVTGDTKVVPRGKGDGIYLNTSGIGTLVRSDLGTSQIRQGDAVLVTGDVGRHGMAVMLARHELGLEGALTSDCAPLRREAAILREIPSLRIMRDPTRGGLATTLCELVQKKAFHIELQENSIPISPAVRAACDMLGIDPLYSACEGRAIAIVAKEDAPNAIEALQKLPQCGDAAIIGEVKTGYAGQLILRTSLGAGRILTKLTGAQLPRIC